MRQESAALAVDVQEDSRKEFGTGLRARLEVVSAQEAVPAPVPPTEAVDIPVEEQAPMPTPEAAPMPAPEAVDAPVEEPAFTPHFELTETPVEVPAPTPARDISPEVMLVSPSTDNVLGEIFARHMRPARKERLGTLLSEAGLLDPAELELALMTASAEGRRLGEILIDFGLVSSADIIRAVAAQRGLPFVDVQALPLDPAAARLLPIDHARAQRTLPIGFVRGLPVVALADPSDEDAMHSTRTILRAAEFVASPEESVLAQLSRVYF